MDHSWLLLSTAAALGFRHGFDWDHIAAIMDIVSTANANQAQNTPVHVRALALSSMYALGHASVVAVLGMCALYFSLVLPAWIDPIVERLVGCTLLCLGVWVLTSLIRHFQGKEEFHLQSRWMIVFELIAQWCDSARTRFNERKPSIPMNGGTYGLRTSFGVGMIHGIGAETGTQVLLIAAIGGAASHGLGVAMLFSFLIGLLSSNTLVALLGSTGFTSSRRLKPLYLTVGAVTGVTSLVVGSYFVTGQADDLPGLQNFFGASS